MQDNHEKPADEAVTRERPTNCKGRGRFFAVIVGAALIVGGVFGYQAIAQGKVRDVGVPELVMTIVTSAAYVFTQSAMIHEVYGVDLDDPAALERMVDVVVSMIFNGITV